MTHSHEHRHSHNYHHNSQNKNLLIATALNVVITVSEIIGGLVSNSLALLSDAVHNLGDTMAVLLAYIADRVGMRDASEKKTFGYKRIEILTALFNALILIIITVFLFIEAYKRILSPEPIKGLIMLIVAVTGLLANLIAVLLLKKHAGNSLNIRAAYLHLLGDTISSVAVIVGSVFIYFYHIYWIDPVITVLIGLYILKETYGILKETVDILMQGTPESIDLSMVVGAIENLPQISNVHHVHSWKLYDKQIHFECHADLKEDLPISMTDPIRIDLQKMLGNKFGISHVTIQFEYNCCDEKERINTIRKH